MQLTLDVMCVT